MESIAKVPYSSIDLLCDEFYTMITVIFVHICALEFGIYSLNLDK